MKSWSFPSGGQRQAALTSVIVDVFFLFDHIGMSSSVLQNVLLGTYVGLSMWKISNVGLFMWKKSKHLKGQLDPPVSDEKCVSRKMSTFLKGCLLLLLLPNDPV